MRSPKPPGITRPSSSAILATNSNLYAEVLKRVDKQAGEPLLQLIAPLLGDETLLSDAHRFREVLKAALGTFFDYMTAHPRIMRMILWEHAEGWQTYVKVASLFEIEGFDRFEAFALRAQAAGLLRSNLDLSVLFMLAEQICWTYPTSLPFYQLVLPGRDLPPPAPGVPAHRSWISSLPGSWSIHKAKTPVRF